MTSSAHGTNFGVIPGDDQRAGIARHDQRVGWHVAAFLAGRNDLEGDVARQAVTLAAASRADRVGDVSVLMAGFHRSWQCLAGGPLRPWVGDSGHPDALAAFASAAAATGPTRALALVVGSHGSGWSVGPRVGALATDRATGSSLSTPALRRALAALHRARGRRLELLVLDACLMATVETVVEVADHVDVVVAPSTRTRRVGAGHAAVVGELRAGAAAGSPVDARALAASWLERWTECSDVALPTSVTALDTRGVDTLVAALDRFGTALAAGWVGGDATAIDAARLDAARAAPRLTDLGSFAAAIADLELGSPAAPAIRTSALAVSGVLTPGGPLVISTSAPSGRRRTMGLNVTLSRDGRPAGYRARRLRAARITGWCSLLDTIATASIGAPR